MTIWDGHEIVSCPTSYNRLSTRLLLSFPRPSENDTVCRLLECPALADCTCLSPRIRRVRVGLEEEGIPIFDFQTSCSSSVSP